MPLPRLRRRLLAALLALPATAFAQSTVLKTATWWNPDEPGWGLFTSDQGGVIAPGWFTYDADGEPTWFLVPGATLQGDGSYRGELFRYRGVPFAQITGNAADPGERIGDAVLRFSGNDALTFQYTVGGTTQTKSLTKFPFGDRQLVCRANSDGLSRAAASNYSDVWWGGAAGSPGWGVHISHVDNTLYATWYTYDGDREAVFMVGVLARQADGSFNGPVARQRNGTPFLQIDGAAASPGADIVGSASLRFSDGETGVFSYTIGDVSQSKSITRLQFGTVANVCETVAGVDTAFDVCSPPLKVGDTWTVERTRSNGEDERYAAEVIGTGLFEDEPVFNVNYRGANPFGRLDYSEAIKQTDDAWIVYQRTGYIADVDAIGTVTFSPPLRIPRRTPNGHRDRQIYTAGIDYGVAGTMQSATITYDVTTIRNGSADVTSPAGTFDDACTFDVTLRSTFVRMDGSATLSTLTEGTRREWRHPSIGTVREQEQLVRNTTGGGGTMIEPRSTIGEIVEAVIDGRRHP